MNGTTKTSENIEVLNAEWTAYEAVCDRGYFLTVRVGKQEVTLPVRNIQIAGLPSGWDASYVSYVEQDEILLVEGYDDGQYVSYSAPLDDGEWETTIQPDGTCAGPAYGVVWTPQEVDSE